MTQTQAGPSPVPVRASGAGAAQPVAPNAAAPGAAGSQKVQDVPQLLNRWQGIAVAVCIVFGLAVAVLQLLGDQANDRAADNTRQLVRVQQIQADLLHADALATNAFLVGGLEPADQRADYDESIERVQRLIAEAASAQPADRAALAELNSIIAAYTGSIEQARDNNRQGFPVGAEYLLTAGTDLRDRAVPQLNALVEANTQRAEDEMGGQHPWWILLLGLLALAALWWLNRQVAKRFRRRINVGLAAAAIAVLLVTVIGWANATSRDSRNDSVREGDFEDAVGAAVARTAGNDAKANESLRLIKRGSGQSYEDDWEASADRVVQTLGRRDVAEAWMAYVDTHYEMVELDESGQWDAAVALATSQDSDGTTAKFEVFDDFQEGQITNSADSATSSLRQGGTLALILSGLSLVLGLAAAALSAWGFGQRRREYA